MILKKLLLLLLSLPVSLFSFCQRQYSVQDLKNGKFKDNSSYVYYLPFEKGKKVFLAQAYDSKMSHKSEYALDFKVKERTKVCAARSGVVIASRKDSEKGGLKPENLSDGNYISIQHEDKSVAHYWHLYRDGVFVTTGDTVKAGQWIGYSGNTGYSAFPHLHFEVQGYDASGNFKQIPTRFHTRKGIIYLRPAKFYRCVRN